MSKHTPGPWMSAFPNRNIVGCKAFDICEVYAGDDPNGGKWDPEAVATAQLISAAPDLLAACEVLLKYLPAPELAEDPQQFAALRLARDAIAKAKGDR